MRFYAASQFRKAPIRSDSGTAKWVFGGMLLRGMWLRRCFFPFEVRFSRWKGSFSLARCNTMEALTRRQVRVLRGSPLHYFSRATLGETSVTKDGESSRAAFFSAIMSAHHTLSRAAGLLIHGANVDLENAGIVAQAVVGLVYAKVDFATSGAREIEAGTASDWLQRS